MTHVARVSITSMTRGSTCAYQADFRDGRMIDPKTLDVLPAPKPAPGVKGTIILIEDLFHNVPIRRNALKNGHNEEYAKCLEVLCKYAVHYAGKVAFSCKKHGSNKMDLNTQLQAGTVDIVRAIYGAQISKELLPIALDLSEAQCHARDIQSSRFSVGGLLSNANFSQKKLTFVLFINHRLVESSNLRRLLDTIYSKYLPRGGHPFVYLSLHLDPRILDVNVHPTKKEVHFLYEEQFCQVVEEAVEQVLKGANKSRVFYTQSLLSGPAGAAASGTMASSADTQAAMARMSTVRVPTAASPVIANVDDDMEDTPAASFVASPAIAQASPVIAMDIDSTPTAAATAVSSAPSAAVAAFNARLTSASRAPSSGPPSTPASANKLFTPLRMPASMTGGSAAAAAAVPPSSSQQPQRRDNSLVRTDNRQGRIDAFLTQSSSPEQHASGDKRKRSSTEQGEGGTAASAQRMTGSRRPKAPVIQLTSVLNLISSLTSSSHPSLSDLFAAHTFVGCVDHAFALVQHQTKLYLINIARVSRAFFYETVLRLFGHLPLLRFSRPIPIRPLLALALKHKDAWRDAPQAVRRREDVEEYAGELTRLLAERASMLHEYFALQIIVSEGDNNAVEVCLAGIPELLESYNPPLLLLPLFLLRLARDVDWTAEQACFAGVAREMAWWYEFRREKVYMSAGGGNQAGRAREEEKSGASTSSSLPPLSWTVAHIFFPLLRHRSVFTPDRAFSGDGTVTQIASLENLYKIFERC